VPSWATAKKQFQNVVSSNGVLIQWLQRSTSGSTAYDTGSTDTYGYGDSIVYWVTGSVRAIVEPIRATEIVQEAGFWSDDWRRIWVDPDETLDVWEQIIYPSGSGTRWLIRHVHSWVVGDVTVSKYADIRKLLPRSGSSY
jgi:hypothetical protein